MGEAELNWDSGELVVRSVFFFYGDMASPELSEQIAQDIADHWNQPAAMVRIRRQDFRVRFDITGIHEPSLEPDQVWYNDNPRFNFFRIEEYVIGDISFVDGLGCNTGYFKLANLLQTSTTAAHEYGHSLGLSHPAQLDIRGRGIPGIMYPRGTLCDAIYQYDSSALPGQTGGTLNPAYRQVMGDDISQLGLDKLSFSSEGLASIGNFSSIYHEKHVPAVGP